MIYVRGLKSEPTWVGMFTTKGKIFTIIGNGWQEVHYSNRTGKGGLANIKLPVGPWHLSETC